MWAQALLNGMDLMPRNFNPLPEVHDARMQSGVNIFNVLQRINTALLATNNAPKIKVDDSLL
jgi:hypothetical protein